MLFMIIAIAGFAIASYMDLKTQYVSDYLQDILIAFGIIGHIIYFLITRDIYPLFWMSVSLITLVPISYILYLLGAWGGGDVKSVAMISSLIPWFNGKPIIIYMIIDFLFVAAFYSTFVTFVYGKKFIKRFDYILLGIALVPFGIFIYYRNLITLFISLMTLMILTPTIKRVDQLMVKEVSPDELVEGDWVMEDVKIGKKLIYKARKEGVSDKDIERIKKSGIKKVKIKYGIPMVPAFLITILVALFQTIP